MKKLIDKLLDVCSENGIKRELTLSVITVLTIIGMIVALIAVIILICNFPKVFGCIALGIWLVYGFCSMKRDITKEIDEAIERRDKTGHPSE